MQAFLPSMHHFNVPCTMSTLGRVADVTSASKQFLSLLLALGVCGGFLFRCYLGHNFSANHYLPVYSLPDSGAIRCKAGLVVRCA